MRSRPLQTKIRSAVVGNSQVVRGRDSRTAKCDRGLREKIEEVSKRCGCAILHDWAQAVSNQVYLCAASSAGNVDLILAKWSSFLRHICNIHTGRVELQRLDYIQQQVQSRFAETRFAETLTLNPNPNPKP